MSLSVSTIKTKITLRAFILFSLVSILLTSCQKTENVTPALNSSDNSLLSASKKTNIILILGDDVGFEVPQYFGGQSYQTPRINQMASEGIEFNQCYSSPLCSPSRFMLLTGKYNFRNY